MKIIIGFFITLLLITSCNQVNNSSIAYSIAENDLIPEGITYSSTTNSFYISSIAKTKIVQINAETGEFNDFISSDLLGMEFLGMIVDDSSGLLWACGNITKGNEHHSTVAKFNLTTGECIGSYLNIDTVAFLYNDLVQDNNGNVYITNSRGQDIYQIDHQTDSVNLFFEGDQIDHPNGITISPDDKYLFVATNNGIRVIDINTRKIIDEPGINKESFGIDGLKYYQHSLIGIQNGVEELSEIKINRYYLDESGTKITKMETIDQNNPSFDIPTTFVIVKGHLYCLANSQLGNISLDGKIINYEILKDILILKYRLK